MNAAVTREASNVVPLSRARSRRMRVVRDERTHLLEQRSDLLAAKTRLRRASDRVAERLSLVDAQLAVLDGPHA